MIIVDFYINDFIFALFLFIKDGKVVNYNGSEIIGLINLKYGKRMAFRDNYFTVNAGFFREAASREKVNNRSCLSVSPGLSFCKGKTASGALCKLPLLWLWLPVLLDM